jgi:gluconolactonase
MRRLRAAALLLVASAASAERFDATLDLATREGAAAVQATWRTAPARIVETAHRAPDADGQPTGAPVATWTIEPQAGAADFDDAAWRAIEPADLAARRGNGRLSFQWYRVALTIPEKIGAFATAGSAVWLQTTLDDYAEVWIDGELARGIGQQGGSVVGGWNAPNRVLVARRAKPGQRIAVAVFGANGPLSDPPANFVWVREARLDFVAGGEPAPVATPPREVNVRVVRADPRIDAIVPANPKIWKLAEGFEFTEGPLWLPDRGVLLFSDPNANKIYEYDPRGDGALRVFREKSGYDAADVAEYGQPGSNGLALDPRGRLTIDEHGRHRVVRLAPDGSSEVLADAFEGRRLNSPNDLVWRADGTLYFTDPPFGLPAFFADPRKQLAFSGVYAWKDGALRVVSKDLDGPNGLAFSPDQKQLYVSNWDAKKKQVLRYDVAADGSLANGSVFFDLTERAPGEIALDGVKVDAQGNVYLSGPGGLWIVAPDGTHLGTLVAPQLPANFAWGDADRRTLYLTARTGLYKTRLGIAGTSP